MNPEQLVFKLGKKSMMSSDQLFRSGSNDFALSIIENYDNWPQNKLILVGPHGCGKTHISSIIMAELNGILFSAKEFDFKKIPSDKKPAIIIIEDMDQLGHHNQKSRQVTEEGIFHLLVKFQNGESKILFTARDNPSVWKIKLPDLSSRLKTFSVVKIDNPDDQLLLNLIIKFFSEKQLNASPSVVNYIASHIERTYESAQIVVDMVDKKALKEKRELTLALVKSVLGE